MKHANLTSVKNMNGSSRAFTLIELMTATGLTVVMLLMMAALYSQTADIIRAGIATSDNIERARASTGEMVRIFDYMVPPSALNSTTGAILGMNTTSNTTGYSIDNRTISGGGMLVIANKMWSARDLYGPYEGSPIHGINSDDPFSWFPQVKSKRLGYIPDDLRSDMLSFFAFNQLQGAETGEVLGLTSITPGGPNIYTPVEALDEDASIVKVWMGHVKRTKPRGFAPISRDVDLQLDEQDPILDSFGEHIANEWVLGMQYLLTGYSDPAVATSAQTYMKSMLDYDDSNDVYSGYGPASANMVSSVGEAVNHAVSDIALFAFDDTTNLGDFEGLIVGNGFDNNALLKPALSAVDSAGVSTADLANMLAGGAVAYTSTNDIDLSSTAINDYKKNALSMTYVNNRLLYNPAPDPNLYSIHVAQTHPGFLPYCSEFIVEFAADCDRDGLIDREGFTDLFANGNPNDRTIGDGYDKNVDTNWNGIKDDGSIIWYSAYQSINSLGQPIGPCMRPNWKLEANGYADGYKQMPDIRRKPSAGHYPFNNADYAFVWRHDYPDNWPFLMRIRFRLMSRSGILEFDPTEPQFDYKFRRVAYNEQADDGLQPNDGIPVEPNQLSSRPDDIGWTLSDEIGLMPDPMAMSTFSAFYDKKSLSFGKDWRPGDKVFKNGPLDRLPGVWYEYIVRVRRE